MTRVGARGRGVRGTGGGGRDDTTEASRVLPCLVPEVSSPPQEEENIGLKTCWVQRPGVRGGPNLEVSKTFYFGGFRTLTPTQIHTDLSSRLTSHIVTDTERLLSRTDVTHWYTPTDSAVYTVKHWFPIQHTNLVRYTLKNTSQVHQGIQYHSPVRPERLPPPPRPTDIRVTFTHTTSSTIPPHAPTPEHRPVLRPPGNSAVLRPPGKSVVLSYAPPVS